MKHLDIYHWSYKEFNTNSLTDYWCTTQIGVVINDKLIDTYWGWPPTHSFSETGRVWTLDNAQEKLILKFIANLNDLEQLTDNPNWYDDVFDFTHLNTSQNLKFIRKGQTRSVTAQINDFRYQIKSLTLDIDDKQRQMTELQQQLDDLLSKVE